jgi:signal transduction histidine kinase
LAIILFILATAATIGSYLSLESSKTAVGKHVYVWEEEIAKNLLLKGDVTLFEKVRSQIPEIAKDVTQVHSEKSKASCAISQTLPITLYGTPSGNLTVCRTYQSVIWEGLMSPVFYILTLIGISFLFWVDHRKQLEHMRLESTQRTALALEQLAKQVAHDIRSPVGALKILASSLLKVSASSEIKSHLDLLHSATSRISKIADDLLQREGLEEEGPAREPSMAEPASSAARQLATPVVAATLESIVREKRLLLSKSAEQLGQIYRGNLFESEIEIELNIPPHPDTQATQSLMPAVDSGLGRVLSNLIQNAMEAPRAKGTRSSVSICLDLEDPQDLVIQIKDNGLGLDRSNARRLGRRGFSFGKRRGVGLGVAHAREWVQARGGRLTYETVKDSGTEVRLNLPR